MKTLRGNIFTQEGKFEYGQISVEKDCIVDLQLLEAADLTESERERYLIPGLVDIHSHGCAGCDTCDGSAESVIKMAEYEKAHGITSYCPTTMTLSEEKLSHICQIIAQAKHPVIKGIYLEGPFISEAKKGAQNAKYIAKPDLDMLHRLQQSANGMIKIVAIAPEVEGAATVIEQAKEEFVFSIAHTAANTEQALAAIAAGAKHVTHLYNAMNPFSHREPGVIGAAADDPDTKVELICDGIHIHPIVIRDTFRLFGKDRVILISDSMEATGMPNGEYALGGQQVFVMDRKATLSDGTIAGSASNLWDCLKYAVEIGVPREAAILAATRNPAKEIGIYEETGSLEVGKKADILIVSEQFDLISVIQGE